MREPERRLRSTMAEALRRDADSLAAEWVDILAERLDVDIHDVLPTGRMLDHVPECLRSIADYVDEAEAGFPTDLLRDNMSALVQLRRHRHRSGIREVLAEYDVLAALLQDWIERTIADFELDVPPEIVAVVVGELKESFSRFGIETARAYRVWSTREWKDRRLQSTGFADMLRHELRNQLGSAQTAAELLIEDGVDAERRERLADLIVRSVEQALETVDVVKQVMTEDEHPDTGTWLPLPDLVNIALGDRVTVGPRIDVDARSVPEVRVPASRVSMVLLNLLDNAFKYHDASKEDQWVRIETEELDERRDADCGWVRISVSDNGRGIDPKLHDRVFQFSVRGDQVESGSGLGLALSRDIVTQLGGRIELESEPGSGTRISFTIPARPLEN